MPEAVTGPAGSLLVRGGTVVDGTGGPASRADVRVRDGRIAEVGRDLRPDGEPELDAGGAVVAPGFIDVHTHFDPSMWWDPAMDPMAAHGVTTVVTGNCSLSLAPLRADQRTSFADVFSYIEDIPLDAFVRAVPWNWEDWPSYRRAMSALSLGVHVAPLVGHSALRLFALGTERAKLPASQDELPLLLGALEQCLDAGAFGLSVSFGDQDRHGEPVPSRAADDVELRAMVACLAGRGGLLEFVPFFNDYGHEQFRADIDRVGGLVRGTGVVATYAPLFSRAAEPDLAPALLDQAARLQRAGARVVPQVSPRPLELAVNFGNTMLFAVVATWGEAANAPAERSAALLADDAWRARARADWDAASYTEGVGGFLTLTSAPPGYEHDMGRTLRAVAAASGRHCSDVLADLVLAADLQPGLTITVGNEDPAAVAGMMRHEATVVGASDAGAHLRMQCGAGDTTLLLTTHVRDRHDLSLEAAVASLTGEIADLVGMTDRGRLVAGAVGDLVVFDLDELEYHRPTPVADVPPDDSVRLTRPPAGFRATVLDGEIVHAGGANTGARPGRVLDATASRG